MTDFVMEKKKAGFHYAWVILFAGVFGIAGALGFGRFGYTVILPSMKAGLNLNYSQMGLIGTANLVGYLIFSLLGGFLASCFQPKAVVVMSLFLEAITLTLTGFARNFGEVLAARFLTGAGSAGANVPLMGLASAWFAPSRRGLAAGVLVSGSGFGVLVTGLWLPGIIRGFGSDGWRYAWYSLAILTMIISFICMILLKNIPQEKGLEPLGRGEQDTQISSEEKVRWGKVYKNINLWKLGFVYFIFGFSYIIYATFFSAHVTEAGGLSEKEAGAIWSTVGFISLLSGVLWGSVSDRIGRPMALSIVFSLHFFSYLIFAISTSKFGFYVSAITFGVSAWSIPSIVAAFAGDLVGPKLAPAALGKVTVIFGLGQAIGPFFAGYLTDLLGSFKFAFLSSAGMVFLGAIISLFLKEATKIG